MLLEVYATLLTPPRIGENLLGKLAYNRHVGSLGPDDHIILIAANGLASVKGTGFVRSGRFDRLQIVQGERTLALTTDGYSNIEELEAAVAPSFREIGIFTLRQDSGFDPLKPWRLDVRLPGGEGEQPTIVSLNYELPDRSGCGHRAARPSPRRPPSRPGTGRCGGRSGRSALGGSPASR